MRHWVSPHGQEELREMITHLSGEWIKWKHSWLSGNAIVRTLENYFIEPIELESIQPYAPLQALRQIGLIQDLPLWSRTALYEDDYNGKISIPRVRKLQDEWDDLIIMPMGQNSWCTPKYFVWINEEVELAWPSKEGLAWLEDAAAALQIYHEILPYYLVTTSMHRQVVLGSVDHML